MDLIVYNYLNKQVGGQMKYSKNIPKADSKVSEELLKQGWTKIKEPKNLTTATLFSIPFMLLNGSIVLMLIYLLEPEIFLASGFEINIAINFSSLIYIFGLIVYLMVHEIIHAALIPDFIQDKDSRWGFNGFALFVYSTQKLKKSRFILVSIAPFIVLSILFPIVLSFMGWLNGYTIILCLINAIGSSVDFMNVVNLLTQAPDKSLIVLNGMETYHQRY